MEGFSNAPQTAAPRVPRKRRMTEDFRLGSGPLLLLDQFDPAVFGPALLGVVGRHGGEQTAAEGS